VDDSDLSDEPKSNIPEKLCKTHSSTKWTGGNEKDTGKACCEVMNSGENLGTEVDLTITSLGLDSDLRLPKLTGPACDSSCVQLISAR
jgi:hypothetical protein